MAPRYKAVGTALIRIPSSHDAVIARLALAVLSGFLITQMDDKSHSMTGLVRMNTFLCARVQGCHTFVGGLDGGDHGFGSGVAVLPRAGLGLRFHRGKKGFTQSGGSGENVIVGSQGQTQMSLLSVLF